MVTERALSTHDPEEDARMRPISITRELAHRFWLAYNRGLMDGSVKPAMHGPDGMMFMMGVPGAEPLVPNYTCAVCGLVSGVRRLCARSRRNYCCKICQAYDWNEGGQKKACRDKPPSAPKPAPTPPAPPRRSCSRPGARGPTSTPS